MTVNSVDVDLKQSIKYKFYYQFSIKSQTGF